MIDRIVIRNFKSIRTCALELRSINIFIGANGVGKSNFISFFSFVNAISRQHLRSYVTEKGGADNLLHFGRKTSEGLSGEITFDDTNRYMFTLRPDQQNNLYFEDESNSFNMSKGNRGRGGWHDKTLGGGHRESVLVDAMEARENFIKAYLRSFQVYHFHDTSERAKIKQFAPLHDNHYLREDGSNLAAYLYFLQQKHPTAFKRIEHTVRSIAPFFGEFNLHPDRLNDQQIELSWFERGSDAYFNAHNLSDGTLRFMALSTLLLQPEPPRTIIIDEPELGLHPFAIQKLASLIKKAATDCQLIISTQSVNLINSFEPEDIVVVDREDRQSIFTRLDPQSLSSWLADYSIGELWEKNVLGGRP